MQSCTSTYFSEFLRLNSDITQVAHLFSYLYLGFVFWIIHLNDLWCYLRIFSCLSRLWRTCSWLHEILVYAECASLSSIPKGDWYCKYCQNMFERKRFLQHDANAVEAGRVSGVDSVEQITKRCIRIVKNLEAELSGCLLCRWLLQF